MKKTLLIGVGNTLRGDDGAGAYVCDVVERLKMPDVTILKAHQLQTEMLEEMIDYDKVLIVDAAIGTNVVAINKVDGTEAGKASSHHTEAGIFKQLALQLYQKNIRLYTCSIPAVNFELGEKLSTESKMFCGQAVQMIVQWLGKE